MRGTPTGHQKTSQKDHILQNKLLLTTVQDQKSMRISARHRHGRPHMQAPHVVNCHSQEHRMLHISRGSNTKIGLNICATYYKIFNTSLHSVQTLQRSTEEQATPKSIFELRGLFNGL